MNIVLTGQEPSRLWIRRRDRHLFETCDEVTLELPGSDGPVTVTINVSDSFWRDCCELRSVQIGRWMESRGERPWPRGQPPKYEAIVEGCSVRIFARLVGPR